MAGKIEFLGSKIVRDWSGISNVTSSCQNAVLWSLMLRKLKPAEYLHCVICITELSRQVVEGLRSSDTGL